MCQEIKPPIKQVFYLAGMTGMTDNAGLNTRAKLVFYGEKKKI